MINRAYDPVWSAGESVEVDRKSSTDYHIPSQSLMETAGRIVGQRVTELYTPSQPVTVLVGAGNNGGDGIVTARYLLEQGFEVHIAWTVSDKLSEMNQTQRKIVAAMGLKAVTQIPRGTVVVDAVLGVGIKGELREGEAKELLKLAAHSHPKAVIAVDLPSGIVADGEKNPSVILPANETITFGARKPAHVLSPCRDSCGNVRVYPIGFAPNAYPTPQMEWAISKYWQAFDPWGGLSPSAHKYDRGHVLVLGGDRGQTGAALMTAQAALSSGAGWVTIATPQSSELECRERAPADFVFADLWRGDDLDASKLGVFLSERKVSSVVCGPGLKPRKLAKEIVSVLDQHKAFNIVDAGFLFHILDQISESPLQAKWLLTPHPGEWQRLSEKSTHPKHLFDLKTAMVARDLTRKNLSILYKSATSILLSHDDALKTFSFFSNSMARAGAGDVLAGCLAGLGKCDLPLEGIVATAHAKLATALDILRVKYGKDGVMMSDLAKQLMVQHESPPSTI